MCGVHVSVGMSMGVLLCCVYCEFIFYMLCKGGATLFRLRLSVASPPFIVYSDVFFF